jgi:hypothetical protein
MVASVPMIASVAGVAILKVRARKSANLARAAIRA